MTETGYYTGISEESGGNGISTPFKIYDLKVTYTKQDNLPDWASPGNWLGPEGHADLKNPVDDPSLCSLCNFALKLFKDEADIMSSLNEFHLLTILSEKKCCLRSVITRFLCNFRECPLVLSL